MYSRSALALAFAASAALAPAAHAETHAWTAAKAKLPAGLTMVGGVNFSVVRSSALFQKMLPMLLGQLGGPGAQLDTIKTTCSIDPLASIDSIAAGFDDGGQGGAVVALKGVTQTQLEACLTKVAGDKKLAITKAGALTSYTGVSDKAFSVAWLDKSTFLITSDPTDPATYKAMTGGIVKDKTIGAKAAATNTDSAAWAVVSKKQDIMPGMTMSMGYGTANLTSGKVVTALHVVFDSPATATKAVDQVQTQLDGVAKSAPGMLTGLLKGISVKAALNEMVIDATVTEADLSSLISMALSGSH